MFRDEKAVAMAVYFLKRAPDHQLNDLALMKLMVIAERMNMQLHTALITGAKFTSMQKGPVLSEVLDLMRGRRTSETWNRCIAFTEHRGEGTPSNCCTLKCDLDVTEHLSGAELDLLAHVWEKAGRKSKWSLVELTHQFPEWDESCRASKTSKPIPLETIFRLGFGESPETARARAEDIEYFEKVAG